MVRHSLSHLHLYLNCYPFKEYFRKIIFAWEIIKKATRFASAVPGLTFSFDTCANTKNNDARDNPEHSEFESYHLHKHKAGKTRREVLYKPSHTIHMTNQIHKLMIVNLTI